MECNRSLKYTDVHERLSVYVQPIAQLKTLMPMFSGHYQVIKTHHGPNVAVQTSTANNELFALWRH